MGQAKRRATNIRPTAVGGGIFGRFFSNVDIYRREAADDVITGMAVDHVGLDSRKIW